MSCGRGRDLSEVKLVELVNSSATGKLFQALHQILVFFCDLVHDKTEIS